MNDAELEQAVREAEWLEMDEVWAYGNMIEGFGWQELGGSKGHKGLGFRAVSRVEKFSSYIGIVYG